MPHLERIHRLFPVGRSKNIADGQCLPGEYRFAPNVIKIPDRITVVNEILQEKTIILKNNNRSGYEYDEFGKTIDEWLRAVGIIPTPAVMRQVA